MSNKPNLFKMGKYHCLAILQLFISFQVHAFLHSSLNDSRTSQTNLDSTKIAQTKSPLVTESKRLQKLNTQNKTAKHENYQSTDSNSIYSMSGGADAGGSDMDHADIISIQTRLSDGSLKRAMLNYLRTIKVEELRNQEIKELLGKITIPQFENDILQSPYYTKNKCQDEFQKSVHASSLFGKQSSPICFDTEKLTMELKSASQEESLLKLAAIAFHEHIHHFQSRPMNHEQIEAKEKQAYDFQVYALNTAKIFSNALPIWIESANMAVQCENIVIRIFYQSKNSGYLFFTDTTKFNEATDRADKLFLFATNHCTLYENPKCIEAKHALVRLKDVAFRIGQKSYEFEKSDDISRLDRAMDLSARLLRESFATQDAIDQFCIPSSQENR